MEYKEYVNHKEQVYDCIIQYLTCPVNSEKYFQILIKRINVHQYQNDKSEFKLILILLNKITKNFHRHSLFLERIQNFFTYFEEHIKQTYTDSEIFNIFKNNKRVLLLLNEMKLLTIDQSITELMLRKIYDLDGQYRRQKGNYSIIGNKNEYFLEKKFEYINFIGYFYPEIEPFLSESERSKIEKEMPKQGENIFTSFDTKRHIGENESYICQLIRQDSIEEFVKYVNQTNKTLSIEITPSIFETNRFLSRRRPTLIEYAAFFGSIQIYQYLRLNQVQLPPSLWLYAIHGQNPEMIHLLEQDRIIPEDSSYMGCFKESIKCHHNDIANYINDNLVNQGISSNEENYNKNSISYGYQYHNYKFINESPNNFQFILYYACTYDHLPIVELLVKSGKVDINRKIVQAIFL